MGGASHNPFSKSKGTFRFLHLFSLRGSVIARPHGVGLRRCLGGWMGGVVEILIWLEI